MFSQNVNYTYFKGSCTSYIDHYLAICHKVYTALEDKKEARMVFLDASKAFDRVWHLGLIFKLEHIGICRPLVTLLKSYLSNRYQRVLISGKSSTWQPIEAGVPQGSILGPLLFLVYINDVTNYIESDIFLYADDTSLLSVSSDPVLSSMELNGDLHTLQTWANQWFITFNAGKTKSMCFSKQQSIQYRPPLFLNGQRIKEVSQHTHLGLTFTNNMSWGEHITKIEHKACKRIGMFNCLKFSLSRNVLIHLYNTLVLPLFDYCDQIYDNCPVAQKQQLDRVQLSAARICTGAIRSTNKDTLIINELGWESLTSRRKRHKLFLFYKIFKLNIQPYLHNLLPVSTRTHVSRYPLNIQQFNCRTEKFKQSFIPSSVVLWNNLSPAVQATETLQVFKHQISSMYLPQKPPSYYGQGKRFYSIIHTRLRLRHNTLNSHLHRIGVKESPHCECGNPDENELHFMLQCPLYALARTRLTETVSALLHPAINFNLLLINHLNEALKILLQASSEQSVVKNNQLFAEVCLFIEKTGRFVPYLKNR